MRWRIIYAGPEECCLPRPKVDVDDSLQDLHNAPINVNFELGVGRGGGSWVKAGGLISKLFFWSNAQGTSYLAEREQLISHPSNFGKTRGQMCFIESSNIPTFWENVICVFYQLSQKCCLYINRFTSFVNLRLYKSNRILSFSTV